MSLVSKLRKLARKRPHVKPPLRAQRTAPGAPFDTIRICVDCLVFHANGDTPPDWSDKRTRRFVRAIERNWPSATISPDASDEGGFSWAGCDSCDSPLGGNLYGATVIPNGWRRPAFAAVNRRKRA